MIKYGKIAEYNGNSGFIIDSEGNKYIVTSNNIEYNNVKENDFVSFKVELYKTIEVEEKIATFVCLENNK